MVEPQRNVAEHLSKQKRSDQKKKLLKAAKLEAISNVEWTVATIEWTRQNLIPQEHRTNMEQNLLSGSHDFAPMRLQMLAQF